MSERCPHCGDWAQPNHTMAHCRNNLLAQLDQAHRIIGENGLELIARAEALKIAWNVARFCWGEWRFAADLRHPPGTSQGFHRANQLAERFPELKEPNKLTILDLLAEEADG